MSSSHNRPAKVFGVGLSRTGTRSLSDALSLLGYRAGHYKEGLATLRLEDGQLVPDFEEVDQWDALTDIPVTAIFRELDAYYPGAKFILTVREREPWLSSLERHLAVREMGRDEKRKHQLDLDTRYAVRRRIYGRADFDPEDFALAYDYHIANVRAHFVRRPDDLLVLDVCSGADWESLCRFLQCPMPDVPFPHSNKSSPR